MTREPSLAEERNNLDPDAVDALADQLHGLLCVPIVGKTAEVAPRHRDNDLVKARVLLLGLREGRWHLLHIRG